MRYFRNIYITLSLLIAIVYSNLIKFVNLHKELGKYVKPYNPKELGRALIENPEKVIVTLGQIIQTEGNVQKVEVFRNLAGIVKRTTVDIGL